MSTNRGFLGVVLIAVSAAGLAGDAAGAGLLIADGGFGGKLEIKEHDVRVVINNGVAVTEVEQVFVNTEDRIVEALYTFPVPKGASVSNFSMWFGCKEMFGEVVEKERARQIYESYKQTRRDPGLLEQVDYKTFEMRVFPIAARAEQRIKVTYYQELDFDHDWATYVYPLATVTRTNIDQRTTGRFALTLDVKSEAPLVEIESPSHRDDFVMVPVSETYSQASLETSEGDLARDVVLAFKTTRPRTGIDVITSKSSGEDGYFQLTLTAGEELAEAERGMDYVFVFDVSGSMANDGKLRFSRDSAFAFMESLSEEDRFEVMTFNVAANRLFGEMRPAREASRQSAREFLAGQRARGGTNLRPAISAAYGYQDADRVLNVVVLSDGMTEQREQRELLQLIRERPSGSRVFCVGVGNEINRPLLRQLAEDAGGLAAFLSDEDSFDRQAEAFRRKLTRPAIRQPKLTFAGAGVYDVEPAELPDLFHGSPLRVYGRYRDAAPVAVTVVGEIQGAPFEQTVEVSLPAADDSNPEIERMWASRRVDHLLAEQRTVSARNANKGRIVELCEGYSIVSPYASFIVLENDAEYRRWKIDRRNASRIVRDRASRQRVREQLRRLRDRSVAQASPVGEKLADAAAPTTST
ncbi:MAG: VIT and VWA domain-containing protein, partial [Planctomycetota bacterium]